MGINKRIKIVVFIIVMLFISGCLMITFINPDRVGKKYYKNSDDYIFTFSTLGFNIVGFKEIKSPLKIKLLGINKGKAINSGRIDGEVPSFYFLDGPNICFYTLQGEKEYKLLGEEKEILSCSIDDLNIDNIPEILIISKDKGKKYGDELIIFSYKNSMKEIYRRSFSDLNPWKVQTADVDGDGVKEISVGVYKTTVFHPVMAKRPFVYGWDGKGIYSKWLGSRLSKPFDDYIFTDIDGDKMEEIIAIELGEDGKKLLNSYKWKGFGFEAMGESKAYDDICELSFIIVTADNRNYFSARVMEKNEWRKVEFCFKENSILEGKD
ncbi:MAG: hypothetical protein K0R09_284 [Clostridiales bacterium]|jgi:hypothetical protein|nr:hypothetical protein [Clostridiales bacterium]